MSLYSPSRARRVPVPSEVRAKCLALRVEKGVHAYRALHVGELTFDDLLAPGGYVTPDVLARVKAKLEVA